MITISHDIFEASAELNLESFSFCPTHLDGLKEWVANLSLNYLGTSSKQLFIALKEIASLQCTEIERIDYLQTIHSPLLQVLNSIEQHISPQGALNTDRNQHIIELAFSIRSLLAKCYVDIVERSTQQIKTSKYHFFKLHRNSAANHVRTVATYYAMQQFSALFYLQYLLYSSPFTGQWQRTHYLMQQAVDANFHHVNINQLLNTRYPLNSINQCYLQLILLEILRTHQLRYGEIKGLYNCTFDWVQYIQISKKPSSEARYLIDFKLDSPPQFNAQKVEQLQGKFFISTQALLDHLSEIQHKKSTPLTSSENKFLTPALHFHIQNQLQNQIERQHARYAYSGQIKVCFGLAVTHYYLSKQKNFVETIHYSENYPNAANLNQSDSYKPQSQWVLLDKEAKTIHKAEVTDISVNGYRLKWTETNTQYLKSGELIIVQEAHHNLWRCGVIRWIKQNSESHLEFGVEIFSHDIIPCAVKNSDDENQSFQPALLIQSTILDQMQTSLIIPGTFASKEKNVLTLKLGDELVKVYLSKAQLITQSFVRYEYELLNDLQLPYMHSFIQKKLNEIKNHDLWEAQN